MAKISHEQKGAVRIRLLDEAAKHFARHGYEQANINKIALEAGFAKGTVYNYFKNKDELFGEVIAEGARRAVARYSKARNDDSIRSSLISLASADASLLREEESFVKVMVGEAMNPRSNTYRLVVKYLSPFLEAVSNILATGVKRGEVRRDVPIGQVTLFFAGILGLLYIEHWKSGNNSPTVEEIPELAVTFFLDGVTVEKTRKFKRSKVGR